MGTIQVKNGQVSKREDAGKCGGKKLAYLEIRGEEISFLPGNFLMMRREARPDEWAFPYMIAGKTPEGFGVYAREDSPLYPAAAGDEVLFWGPSGKGISKEEGRGCALLVQEPAAYLAVSLALAYGEEGRIAVLKEEGKVEENSFFSRLPIPFSWVGPAQAAEWLSRQDGNIYAAASPTLLQPIFESVPEEIIGRTYAFANTKIGCGTGACKGCVLHHPDYPAGIPVCCSGPFLPYREIDWKLDAACIFPF